MAKLSHRVDGEWQIFERPPVFAMETMEATGSRIVAAAPRGCPSLLAALADEMTAPLFLLYVLHTPRGEGEAGRYQSPPLAAGDVTAFLKRFGSFLANDSRCDLWVHSPADAATIVCTTSSTSTATPKRHRRHCGPVVSLPAGPKSPRPICTAMRRPTTQMRPLCSTPSHGAGRRCARRTNSNAALRPLTPAPPPRPCGTPPRCARPGRRSRGRT